MKNWKIPAIILLVLLLAFAFRWESEAKTTTNGTIIKYETDRWNGSVWRESFVPNNHTRIMIEKNKIAMDWNKSENLTYIWVALAGVSAIWLIISLIPVSASEKSSQKGSKGMTSFRMYSFKNFWLPFIIINLIINVSVYITKSTDIAYGVSIIGFFYFYNRGYKCAQQPQPPNTIEEQTEM